MRILLAVAAMLTACTIATATPAEAHDHLRYAHGVRPCHYEDGSGQPGRLCVWDHRHMGNGYGDLSILIHRGGTDRAVYDEITHRRAHRLIHRYWRFQSDRP